jgi:RNA recognition motif-containing protein
MGKKLYIGNLPYSVTEQILVDTFSQVGAVESAKVITDRDTGRSKGFAFVEMVEEADAQKVVEQYNGSEYEGRRLTVSEARPMAPREPRAGGFGGGAERGGRGGFGGGDRGGRGGRGGFGGGDRGGRGPRF